MSFTPLNALHGFIAVARHQSFAAAAKEIHVSPSALSQSVRSLEMRLGMALLKRTTRSVSLTDAGRRLLEEAAPGVSQALEALRTATARPGEISGRLRLTIPPFAVHVVNQIVPRFLAQHPKIEVEIQVENRHADIVAEGFDAGVRLEKHLERDMVHLRLTKPFRFVVVGAPSYLEKRGVPESPKDLLSHECIGYRPNGGAVLPWCFARGKKPPLHIPIRGAMTTNDVDVMLAMAEGGVGLAWIPEPTVASRIQRESLVVVLEAAATSMPGLFLYYPSRAQTSPVFRAFIETARQVTSR